ncbi:MAG TPA: helix-turn-helix transcriptional regulator [Pseudonocardiaceae bacterium]|nr:helix-turn-helix transcriptional regulator [Pseudonocardiaceae bacterium]
MTTVVPAISRLKLGRILREWRNLAGLTLEQCEADLDMSTSALGRVENGQQNIHPMIVRAMLELYHTPEQEWDDILELAKEAKRRTEWQNLGVAAHAYVVLESEAIAVRSFQPAFIPGLLQTVDYAREVFDLDSAALRRRNLAIRLKRRERLDGPNPLTYDAIVDETALRRPLGDRTVRREQLAHLIEVAALPTITLRVLPISVGANVGMRGAFNLLTFPPDTIDDIGYVDHAAGSSQITKPDRVKALANQFRQIEAITLPPTESLGLVAHIAGQLR